MLFLPRKRCKVLVATAILHNIFWKNGILIDGAQNFEDEEDDGDENPGRQEKWI